MRVLVCGGRWFGQIPLPTNGDAYQAAKDKAAWERIQFWTEMLQFDCKANLEIIQGGATGADRCARDWAGGTGHRCRTFEADWKSHGKVAGPIRNQQMLDEGKPDLVMAFPGGRGTADMVARARKAGVRVIEISRTHPGGR